MDNGKVVQAPFSVRRVLVVSRSPMFGEALAHLVNAAPGFCALHSSPEELGDVVDGAAFEIALVDAGADGLGARGATHAVRRHSPEARIVVLVKAVGTRSERLAAEVGAAGWLPYGARPKELIDALDTTVTVSRPRSRSLGTEPGRLRSADEVLMEQLTARELEVLRGLAAGAHGRDLAARLGISPNTLRTHVQNIMLKLGVHSRMEAISFARRCGVLSAAGGGRRPRGSGSADTASARRSHRG